MARRRVFGGSPRPRLTWRCGLLPLAALMVVALLGPTTRITTAEVIGDPTFCPTLERLVAAADEGFASIEGAVKHGPLHVWAATVTIPGGTDCRVFSGPLPIYGCMLYFGDDDEAADATYRDVGSRALECLGTGWTSMTYETGVAAQTVLSRSGGKVVVRVSSRLSDAVSNEIRFWIDGPQRRIP
jgi:hypothetical protein